MQSLHHDVSPWHAGSICMQAVMHAAQDLRQCHMRGRQPFMAHGVRVDQSKPPGVFWQMPIFLRKFVVYKPS